MWGMCSPTETDRDTVSQSYGGHSGGETPGPIPNPEAKPSSADGTALDRVWESRTPPNTTSQNAPDHPWSGAFCIRNHAQPQQDSGGRAECVGAGMRRHRHLHPPAPSSPYGPPVQSPTVAHARALAGREQNSDTTLHAPDKRARVRGPSNRTQPQQVDYCHRSLAIDRGQTPILQTRSHSRGARRIVSDVVSVRQTRAHSRGGPGTGRPSRQ